MTDEIEQLRLQLAKYQQKSKKISWLLKQIGRKIRHWPRDTLRRLRRSIQKRRGWASVDVTTVDVDASDNADFDSANASIHAKSSISANNSADSGVNRPKASPVVRTKRASTGKPPPFHVHAACTEELKALLKSDMASRKAVAEMGQFLLSVEMRRLIDKAVALEPDIGAPMYQQESFCPPWHDLDYRRFRQVITLLAGSSYDSVVLMPAGRMGGADLVAAVLARSLSKSERVLILRTDDNHWDRPDWYPEDVVSVDISGILKEMADRRRALYHILCEIGAPRIFNVNSRLAFETYLTFGAQLATQFRLYAYYFCADRTEQGIETGYPIWFFSNIFHNLTAAMIDTRALAQTLTTRFAIPADEATKLSVLYTPAQMDVSERPVAEQQIARAHGRRPCILWGGRLDRQKRFDVVVEVARAMLDVDFRCWGKAVLDKPPKLEYLPQNLTLNPPFTDYDELPLADSDGWLYTSSWDGLPTILIELGALGMPIVASAVGGVPELIDETTGWLFDAAADADEVVAAIREMLADPEARVTRATALQERVRKQHATETYCTEIAAI